MSDLFSNGVSGLLAFQRQLTTTGHNIANANTPGYSRQRAELVTRDAHPYGNGFIGSGVDVSTIERLHNRFLTEDLRLNLAENSRLGTYVGLAERVDNLLADSDAGLSPALDAFFNAAEGVASDPKDIPARQVLLSEAEGVANRFQVLQQRFASLNDDVNLRVRQSVSDINRLADTIASLNDEIRSAQGRVGQPPNDLMDQRDQALSELSELVRVRVTETGDGTLNVAIGNGQALVSGTTAMRLDAVTNPDGSPGILYSSGTDITAQITGGSLGGALDFRRELLAPAWEDLSELAATFAEAVNDQQAQGWDLNEQPGGPLFAVADPLPDLGSDVDLLQVVPREPEEVAAALPPITVSGDNDSATVTRIAAGAGTLPGNFTITFGNGGDYDIADENGNPVASGTLDANNPVIAHEGWSLTFSGVPNAGTEFQATPNETGTGDNRNALALSELRNEPLLNGASVQDAYGTLVARVGTDTRQAQAGAAAQGIMLEQAQQAVAEVSGVNLDEEAANLLRFQQAYMAAAQVISTADTLFQTLLGAVRR